MEKEFYMKNYIKFFGIIAFVAVIGFSFISCEEEEEITLFDAKSGEQSKITITGIPDTYNDKFAVLNVFTEPQGVALGTKIVSGSVTLDLLNSDNAKAAYAEGYYSARIRIFSTQTQADDAKNNTPLYSKDAASVEIKKGAQSIAFSAFNRN